MLGHPVYFSLFLDQADTDIFYVRPFQRVHIKNWIYLNSLVKYNVIINKSENTIRYCDFRC